MDATTGNLSEGEIELLQKRVADLKSCHKTRECHEQIGIRSAKEVVDYNHWGEPIEEARYEYVPGPPRPIADIRNELANRLATLGRREAAVRIGSGSRHVQGIVQIPDVQDIPHDPSKIERIRALSRARYARPRTEVEAAIAARHDFIDQTFGEGAQHGTGPGMKKASPTLGVGQLEEEKPAKSWRRRVPLDE